MRPKVPSCLTYANVMASAAVFIALGGSAYAATKLPRNSVGTPQIKKNAVNSAKVKDKSLMATDFKTGQLPRGLPGAPGTAGAKGDAGARGSDGAKGDKGTAGDDGTDGADGADGPRGPSDVYTATQNLGDCGATGPFGGCTDGGSASVAVPAGDYSVTMTGQAHNITTYMGAPPASPPPSSASQCAVLSTGSTGGAGGQTRVVTVPGSGWGQGFGGGGFIAGSATVSITATLRLPNAGTIDSGCSTFSGSPSVEYRDFVVVATRVATLHP